MMCLKYVLFSVISFSLIPNSVLIANIGHEEKVNFLRDYLQFLHNAPFKIRAYLCLPLVNSINLMHKTFALNRQIMIHSFNHSPFIDWSRAHHDLNIVDLDCKGAVELLKQSEEQNIFKAPFSWLLIGTNIINDIQFRYKDLINLLPDSNVVIAEPNTIDSWLLKQPYKIQKNYSIILEDFGSWSKIYGIRDDRTTSIIARRRKDLQGIVMKTSAVFSNNDSINHLTDYKDLHIDTVPKNNYFYAMMLLDFVNATSEINFLNVWGYRQPNSTQYTGMIGQLQRKEIELSVTPVFMTVDRVPIIAYVSATTKARTVFAFRQPPLSYISNVYTLPFSTNVWIAETVLLILISGILYLNLKWEKIHENAQKFDTGDVVLVAMGAICQQGTVVDPKSGAGRATIFLLFLVLMFFYTSYAANIVALLQSSSNSIQTLEDLLNSKLELGVQDVFYNHHYFKTAEEPIRKAIYERKIAPPGKKERFMSIEEGVKRMQYEPFGFHIEKGALYKLMAETFLENEKCGLSEISYLQVNDPFLVAQKNTSYLEIFKIGFQLQQERGLSQREFRIFFLDKPKCLGTGNSFSSVGLNEIVAAFYILFIGTGCSVLIAVFEYFSRPKNNFNRN